MVSILIIFGSTSGNTELVCDKVSQVLREKKYKVVVQRAEQSTPSDINKYTYCILASSTYGQGILQDHMLKFIKKCSRANFKDKKFAVIGLGDNKYNTEYIIESAKILEKKITENDGVLLTPSLRINKTPVLHLEDTIKTWAMNLSKKLK